MGLFLMLCFCSFGLLFNQFNKLSAEAAEFEQSSILDCDIHKLDFRKC